MTPGGAMLARGYDGAARFGAEEGGGDVLTQRRGDAERKHPGGRGSVSVAPEGTGATNSPPPCLGRGPNSMGFGVCSRAFTRFRRSGSVAGTSPLIGR